MRKDLRGLYEDIVGSAFTMFPLWTILRNAKKWQDDVSNKEKRKRKARTLTADELKDVEEGGARVSKVPQTL